MSFPILGSGMRQSVTVVNANPGNVVAGRTLALSLAVTLAVPDQIFIVQAPALEAGLILSNPICTTAGTVIVTIGNLTAGDINPAAQDFYVIAL